MKIDNFEKMSNEEIHDRYLKYLGIDEDTYQEVFKELNVNVKDINPAIYLGPIQGILSKGKSAGNTVEVGERDVVLDLNTVRNMGMIIDPFFLLELSVNGIIVDFKFRLAKKGEVPDKFLRENF